MNVVGVELSFSERLNNSSTASWPKVVEIAMFLIVMIFNEGFESILKILETTGVKIGPQAKK